MSAKIFVDTNVLVYAHDLAAGNRHKQAMIVIENLWDKKTGVISTQVFQEFYVTVTRKIANPLDRQRAREIIRNYLAWPVHLNDAETVLLASEIEARNNLSFWDALIVAAAQLLRVDKIFTEDMNHGQRIEGILIANPFLER
jgi:predicted nucleic acid-binding protein